MAMGITARHVLHNLKENKLADSQAYKLTLYVEVMILSADTKAILMSQNQANMLRDWIYISSSSPMSADKLCLTAGSIATWLNSLSIQSE